MATLSGILISIFGRTVPLHNWPVAIIGKNSSGNPVALKLADDGTVSVTGAGAARTPTISTLTGTSTVAAGARKLTLIFSSDFTGSVLGVAFVGGVDNSVNIDAPSGDTLGAVAYVVTTGSIRAVKVV